VNSAAVLVVDDDGPIRKMLERMLSAEGCEVACVGNGGEALAAVERSVPDLIILDVAMPGLDGLAVCRRLRAKGLALPILLLTARDAVADRVDGLDAGADDYLAKPFAPEELLARARALLRRGSEPDALLAFDDLVLDVRTHSVRRGERKIALSAREAEMLELLLRNPRQVIRMSLARLRPSLVYGPMLLAWNSKFGPRARWSDSSHSREPMDVNAAGGPLAIG
jgi:two-component system response regulator MprA